MADPTPYRPYQPGTQPPYDVPAYLGTTKRHPKQTPHPLPHSVTETTGPSFSAERFPPIADLTMPRRPTGAGRADHRRRYHHR